MRILGRDDEERIRQGPGFALGRDLLFFHGFQQGALRLGAGPVDLVGQQHLGKYRAGMEHEGLLAALVDRYAGKVAGHQVGRELHTRKVQPETARQRVRQRGLADAGNVLDQQVSASQQAGDAILDLRRFSDDDRVKLTQ
jgi:hypothetical protein